jgi:hypothetical protein
LAPVSKLFSTCGTLTDRLLEQKTKLLWTYLIDDIIVILIFLFSFSLPLFLQGFLWFFLGHFFVLLLTFSHDYSPSKKMLFGIMLADFCHSLGVYELVNRFNTHKPVYFHILSILHGFCIL